MLVSPSINKILCLHLQLTGYLAWHNSLNFSEFSHSQMEDVSVVAVSWSLGSFYNPSSQRLTQLVPGVHIFTSNQYNSTTDYPYYEPQLEKSFSLKRQQSQEIWHSVFKHKCSQTFDHKQNITHISLFLCTRYEISMYIYIIS